MSERENRDRRDRRGDHGEEARSPIAVGAGQQPPRDGEWCGALTFDAALRMWLYVASYDDQRVCWQNQARSLHRAYGVPFVCVYIGDTSNEKRRGGQLSEQRYIPGWYAATYADPRGKEIQ